MRFNYERFLVFILLGSAIFALWVQTYMMLNHEKPGFCPKNSVSAISMAYDPPTPLTGGV